MADAKVRNRPQEPGVAQVDEGLAHWANLFHSHLATQAGVEIVGKHGGTVNFKFRGQTFSVSIQRQA